MQNPDLLMSKAQKTEKKDFDIDLINRQQQEKS